MGTDKRFNEMLARLRRPSGTKTLKAPKPIQTQKTPCSSWEAVKNGFQLKSIKQFIPADSLVAPILPQKTEKTLVDAVEAFLKNFPMVIDPTGVYVKLNVFDRDPTNPAHTREEPRSLRFRAMHLCGGHEYSFDVRRARYSGCIVETIKNPAIIAEGNNKRFYLRRYKDRTLHVVIVSEPKNGIAEIEEVAYQKTSDLVTQYPNIPALTNKHNPENAQVIYKRP